ncbi:MAG: MGMT family protein, partial [Nanoarchaeota archaeon]
MNFNERVYKITSRIPRGRVSTYKAVARALNCKAYRAVGNALNKNPYAPKVPCHRVISSSGFVDGFARGIKAKIRMLRKEGV